MAQAPSWTYYPRSGQYRIKGQVGRASQAQVLEALDSYLATKRGSVGDALWQLLRDGAIDVREAQISGAREIVKSHTAAAMLAKGGRSQMSRADYERVGAIVKQELTYWRDFMGTLAEQPNGTFRAIDGPVKSSLRGYFAAPANTFAKFQGAEMALRGYSLVENVLDDGARHCGGGGISCPEVTAMGFIPIDEMPPRGSRNCSWNCRCGLRYKSPATGEVME